MPEGDEFGKVEEAFLQTLTKMEKALRQYNVEAQRLVWETNIELLHSNPALILKLKYCRPRCPYCPHGPYWFKVRKIKGKWYSKYLGLNPEPSEIKKVGLYPSKIKAANRKVADLSKRKKAITMAIRRAQRILVDAARPLNPEEGLARALDLSGWRE